MNLIVAVCKKNNGIGFENKIPWYLKEELQYLDKDASYHMNELFQKKGLNTQKVWYEALDAAPEHKIRYIRRMRENGEQLNKKPRITLSTIHSAKGGEADNVILFTDIPHRTWKAYEKEPDDDTRVFYVGLTRAKQKLHIIQPTTNKYFMV